MNFVLTIHIP